MIDFLSNFDNAVSSFIVSSIPHTAFLDYIFAFLSLKGAAIPVWLIPLSVLIFVEQRQDKRFIFFFFFNFVLTLLSVHYIFKEIFQRLRPLVIIPSEIYSCPVDFSFPSGHAATAFAAATTLSFFDRKRSWLYFTIAVLIALSRIYFQCHYFLDTVIGAFVGIAISRVVLLFYKQAVIKKEETKKL